MDKEKNIIDTVKKVADNKENQVMNNSPKPIWNGPKRSKKDPKWFETTWKQC